MQDNKKYCVILLRSGKIPDKSILIKKFKDLFYREPTNDELNLIKLDMQGECVIITR